VGQGGLQIRWDSMGLEQGGLQIMWDRIALGQGGLPAGSPPEFWNSKPGKLSC